jgi:hypothetical protein
MSKLALGKKILLGLKAGTLFKFCADIALDRSAKHREIRYKSQNILNRPRGGAFFIFLYIPLCIKWKHCAALGASPQQWFKKRFREKNLLGRCCCVHLFCAQTSRFFKKKVNYNQIITSAVFCLPIF